MKQKVRVFRLGSGLFRVLEVKLVFGQVVSPIKFGVVSKGIQFGACTKVSPRDGVVLLGFRGQYQGFYHPLFPLILPFLFTLFYLFPVCLNCIGFSIWLTWNRNR